MKPTHTAEISVHRRASKRALPLLLDARQAVHDRDGKNGRRREGNRAPKNLFGDKAFHDSVAQTSVCDNPSKEESQTEVCATSYSISAMPIIG
jgi:hypothetical protein